MSDLVVIGFDTEDGATAARTECAALQKEYLIDLADAVVVRRTSDGKVHLDQSVNLTALGFSGGLAAGALWGTLLGLIFLNPLAGFVAGSVTGAGMGALEGQFSDYGISDDFIRQVGQQLKDGTSALFILVRRAQPEKVVSEFRKLGGHPHILQTSLSPEADAKLRSLID